MVEYEQGVFGLLLDDGQYSGWLHPILHKSCSGGLKRTKKRDVQMENVRKLRVDTWERAQNLAVSSWLYITCTVRGRLRGMIDLVHGGDGAWHVRYVAHVTPVTSVRLEYGSLLCLRTRNTIFSHFVHSWNEQLTTTALSPVRSFPWTIKARSIMMDCS